MKKKAAPGYTNKHTNKNASPHTDAHHAGRNLLRQAFLKATGRPWATPNPEYPGCTHSFLYIVEPERPLYWYADPDPTDVAAPLPFLATERDVKNVCKFLAEKGIEALNEQEDAGSFVAKRPWKDGDLVRYNFDPPEL